MSDDNQTTERWPGKVDDYRHLTVTAETCEDGSLDQAAFFIAAQIAGLSQILDKIAYAARAH